MKRTLIAAAAMAVIVGMTGAAAAADMRPQPYKAPQAYAVPVYNWTGFYVGLNAGYSWGSSNWSALGQSFNTNGGLVGGQLGYNWQNGALVLGLETDLQWSGASGSGACGFGCSTSDRWFGTTRGRIGYAIDRWMPYFTGGVAYGDIRGSGVFGTQSTTNTGWALGGGLEFAVAPAWTMKVEYLHIDLGSMTCTVCSIVPSNVSFTDNIVRAGLNVRF